MEPAFRRKQLIVDRDTQRDLVIRIAWPAMASTAIAVVGLLIYANWLRGQAAALGVEVPSLAPAIAIAAFFVFVSSAFVVFHALRISHRVAGPAYRMQADLVRVRARGEWQHRVRLRDGDYLMGLADEINVFLEWNAGLLAPDAERTHEELSDARTSPSAAHESAAAASR